MISFSQVKLILKKNGNDRKEEDIKNLSEYFKNNAFFKKHGDENGESWLSLIYNSIKYEHIRNDKYVIRFGEFGTTYYIILKGKVQVR